MKFLSTWEAVIKRKFCPMTSLVKKPYTWNNLKYYTCTVATRLGFLNLKRKKITGCWLLSRPEAWTPNLLPQELCHGFSTSFIWGNLCFYSVPAKLSGADWSVVSRVGEEDGPAILQIHPALSQVWCINFTWIQLWKSMFPCVVSDWEDMLITSIQLWTPNSTPEEKFGTTSPSLSTCPGMVATL